MTATYKTQAVGPVEVFFRRGIPDAETYSYDTGHFAFETHEPEIAAAMLDFLAQKVRAWPRGAVYHFIKRPDPVGEVAQSAGTSLWERQQPASEAGRPALLQPLAP